MNDKNRSDIDRINLVLKELEEKSCTVEEDLSELKSDVEAARMNLILSNNRQKKLKESEDRNKDLEA